MNLAALIAAHDVAALEALTSPGLVRRAGKDLDAGKARVIARDKAEARVEAGGYELAISGGCLAEVQCPCPATGICKHVILAVLALRATDEGRVGCQRRCRGERSGPPRETRPGGHSQICRCADLPSAVALAAESQRSRHRETAARAWRSPSPRIRMV